MKKEQKVYIRGCKGRGSEIAGILTGLGAAAAEVSCVGNDRIYFITHDNNISVAFVSSELGRIIMDNYKEIPIPREPWNDGDILIDDSDPKSYAVFKEYKNTILLELILSLSTRRHISIHQHPQNIIALRTQKELEDLPHLFTFLIGALNKVGLCLPKEVVKYSTTDDVLISKSIKL